MRGVISTLPIAEGPVAAVVAHPDDETFGLGALLAHLAGEGREVRLLCFTHGEASTLGAAHELGDVRRRELFAANLRVDRTAQLAAIRCHASQLDDDPVVCRVLALHGDTDRVRIRPPHGQTGG